MLAFEKQLPESWITEPAAAWNTAQLGGLEGRTLGHRSGSGPSASEVARRALAFDMEVVGTPAAAGPAPVDGVALVPRPRRPCSAGPTTWWWRRRPPPATRHLLDEAAFAAVKPGVHLVNVARGSLVDQDALLRALDDGRVAMASLDVVDPEPLPDGHPLYRHPSVRLSPHISWSSPRTVVRTITCSSRTWPATGRDASCSGPSTRRPATDGTRRPGAVLGHAAPAGDRSPSGWPRPRAPASPPSRCGAATTPPPGPRGCSDADLRSMLDDHGLAVAELDPAWWWLPGAADIHIDPRHDSEDVFRFGEAELFAVADAVGGRSVNAVDVFGGTWDVDDAAEAFAGLCARAAEHGLLVHLEWLPWSRIPDLATALDIVRQAGAPNGGINVDAWHLVALGHRPRPTWPTSPAS